MPEQKRTTEARYLSGQGEAKWSRLQEEASELHLRLGRLRRLPHRPLPRRGTPIQPHLGLVRCC